MLLNIFQCLTPWRSSHPQVLYKKFLKSFKKVNRNALMPISILIKLQTCNFQLCQKKLWHRRLFVNFANFLRTAFLQNFPGWLFLSSDELFMKKFKEQKAYSWLVRYLRGVDTQPTYDSKESFKIQNESKVEN